MRYTESENPYIWCRFTTGDSVTITIYKSSDSSVIVNAVSMSELVSTGYFKYQFNPSPTELTEYFYIATNTIEEHAGKIILGGYPDSIKDETDKIQTGIIDVKADYKATGFSVPNEYDTELNNIKIETDKIQPGIIDVKADYKATGFSVPNEYDTQMGYIPSNLSDVPTAAELIATHGSGAWTTADISTLATSIALTSHDNKLDVVDAIIDRILIATETRQCTIIDIAPSSLSFETSLTETSNQFWKRGVIKITSGVNEGQQRAIENYDGSLKSITLKTPLDIAPANGDTFIILAARKYLTPDIEDIINTVWDEPKANHIIDESFGKAIQDTESNISEIINDDIISNAVWDTLIVNHTMVGSFGEKNQKAVPSEILNDYKATEITTTTTTTSTDTSDEYDTYEFGETIRFVATVTDENEALCTPENVTISIKRSNNTLDELNTSMVNDSTGMYHYDFTANVDDTLGVYTIHIMVVSSTGHVTIERNAFELISPL